MDRKKKKKDSKKIKWVLLIFLWTFILAVMLSFISESLIKGVGIIIALIILLFIISIGVFFDLIGIAVAASSEIPFHSMAAKKIKGAKQAVFLVKNAGQVSNFCNDVVGDICGIVSGAAGAAIVFRLINDPDIEKRILSIIIAGMIAALTVGGKAIGKTIAIRNSNLIVAKVGYIIYILREIFNIKLKKITGS